MAELRVFINRLRARYESPVSAGRSPPVSSSIGGWCTRRRIRPGLVRVLPGFRGHSIYQMSTAPGRAAYERVTWDDQDVAVAWRPHDDPAFAGAGMAPGLRFGKVAAQRGEHRGAVGTRRRWI